MNGSIKAFVTRQFAHFSLNSLEISLKCFSTYLKQNILNKNTVEKDMIFVSK
jgi:hypothetical protein